MADLRRKTLAKLLNIPVSLVCRTCLAVNSPDSPWEWVQDNVDTAWYNCTCRCGSRSHMRLYMDIAGRPSVRESASTSVTYAYDEE